MTLILLTFVFRIVLSEISFLCHRRFKQERIAKKHVQLYGSIPIYENILNVYEHIYQFIETIRL